MNTSILPSACFLSRRSRPAALLLAFGFTCLPWLASSVSATSRTWSGAGSDSNWNTSGNWGGSAPGNNSTDIATFNTAIPVSGKGGVSNPVITNMASNVPIYGILFDTSSAGSFVFGTNGGSTLYLRANGGSITMNSAVVNTQTFNSPISLINGGNAHTYSFINNASLSSAQMLINGNVTSLLSAANDNTLRLGGSNTGTNTISGNISGTSGAKNYSMIKDDAGTWVLSGANTMHLTSSGTIKTTINAGTLQFAKAVSLYNADTTKWTAATINVKSGATLALNVGGTGEFTTSNVTTLAALGGAASGLENGARLGLDTTNAAGGNFTHTTAITDTFSGANAIGLRKLGANTLTLTGVNTYTGGTSVEEGTLALTQNFAMSGSNGFTINDTTAAVAGVNYAQLAFSGTTLTYGGSLVIDFKGTLSSTTVYDLISFVSGSASGDFSGVSIAGSYVAALTKSGNTWTGSVGDTDFSFDQLSGDLTVTISTVPEPSAWALVLGGAALAGVMTHRRRWHGLHR